MLKQFISKDKKISGQFAVLCFACCVLLGCGKNPGPKQVTPIDPPKPPVAPAEEPPPVIDTSLKIGAYYFDGWTGQTFHIRTNMDIYTDRKPLDGWITSTPEKIKEQIDQAADAGLKFFSFCWYFTSSPGVSDNSPMNNALKLYLQAPNKSRMKFCLLVANHQGFIINPSNWPFLKSYWVQLFKEPNYLTVNGKPVIIFFEFAEMKKNFGSAAALKSALEIFNTEVKNGGMRGVSLAVCAWPSKEYIEDAKNCGFEIVSYYNHHSAGLSATSVTAPIENMSNAEYNTLWPAYKNGPLPVMPVSTLNWDLRPWSDNPETEKRFVGFSEESVAHSVGRLRQWIYNNGTLVTREKIGLLYAWNEYGEGGWLTPSIDKKDSLLLGLKRVLK